MDVKHVAELANLTLTSDQEKKLESQFDETLKIVDTLNKLDTSGVSPTAQVDPNLINVTRPDEIDENRIIRIGDYFKVYVN